ncbi:MAG: hypothetical protein ACRC46_05000 [Thermoguttaceae bacterium]
MLVTLGMPSLHRSLCEAGMHDTALVYIDWVASRPFVPDEIKTGRDLAVATTHLSALANGERSANHNELAREAITRALAADPANAEATLLAARLRFQDANAVSVSTESRRLFGEAGELATNAAALANAVAKAARQRGVTDSEQTPTFALIMQGKLLAIESAHRCAMTFPENSTERTEQLRAAADVAKAMARRYAAYQGGLEAKCLAAEILYDAGDPDATREVLSELEPLAWSDFPNVRMRGLRLVLEINRREHLWDDSRTRIAEWLAKTSPSERNSREGVACYEVAAKTALGESETLGRDGAAALHKHAQTLLLSIPFALRTDDVHSQLTALGGSSDGTAHGAASPTTLDEAERLIDQRLATVLRVERDANSSVETKRAATAGAIDAINAAMQLAGNDVANETRNRWRRQLARLYAASGDQLAATIVAASTLPASVWSEAGAKMGEVPPLLRLAIQSGYAAREAERGINDGSLFNALTPRLARLAWVATTHFPATPPARDAERIVVVLLVESERFDEALTTLEQIDDATTQRLASRDAAVAAWNLFASARDARSESAERPLSLTEQLIERGSSADGASVELPGDDAFARVVSQIESLRSVSADLRDEVDRLADAGEFGEAIAVLTARIKEHPNNLPLQQRAATLAATQGERDATAYDIAIDGNETLWGWSGIAARTASDKSLRETYFAACYEKWRCMLLRAATFTGEDREQRLRDVRRDWERFQILRPEAGGAMWRGRYEKLFSGEK